MGWGLKNIAVSLNRYNARYQNLIQFFLTDFWPFL